MSFCVVFVYVEIKLGDVVRLTEPCGGLEAGAEGRVFGFYRRPDREEVSVAFGDRSIVVPPTVLEWATSDAPRTVGG
jgi:hypothetical protein